MAKLSTLADDFTTNRTDLWTDVGPVAVTGGALVLDAKLSASAGAYLQRYSTATYDATSDTTTLQVQSVSVGGFSVQCAWRIENSAATSAHAFYFENGVLHTQSGAIGASDQNHGTLDYAAHAHQRLVHDGTNVLFQVSSDRVTWTTLRTATPISGLTTARLRFNAGHYDAAQTANVAGTFKVDNLNAVPVADLRDFWCIDHTGALVKARDRYVLADGTLEP